MNAPLKGDYRTMTLTTPRMDRPANQHNLTPHVLPKATRKVVALGPIDDRADVAELFRSRGWEVVTAETGKETRKLAVKHGATLAVFPARGEPETGWMSCLKLVRTGRKRRVILVGEVGDREAENFARFAGATAYLTPEDGLEAIWEAGSSSKSQPVLN